MRITARLDEVQRRHPMFGFPLAVIYKYVDDQGSYLAALITYYAFVSLFPLLLIASTVLGVVLSGDSALQHQLLTSALRSMPVEEVWEGVRAFWAAEGHPVHEGETADFQRDRFLGTAPAATPGST